MTLEEKAKMLVGFETFPVSYTDISGAKNFPGKEVVELYLGALAGKLDKLSGELKGFAKTALLQAGKNLLLRSIKVSDIEKS